MVDVNGHVEGLPLGRVVRLLHQMIKRLQSRLGYQRRRNCAPGLGGCQLGATVRHTTEDLGEEIV